MSAQRGNHLAPSPNWYCPHISDCSPTGLLAYGARHELVILRINVDPPVYELIENVHSDRVAAVAFSNTSSNVIATGSDDCFVKIWNVKSDNAELSLSNEKELKFEQKISCVTWQYESATVFIAEGQMNVWMWNVRQDTKKMLKHGIRNQPVVLAGSPHKTDLLAIGFKGGILAILDITKNGNVLMKLKGHNEDVISLSWNSEASASGESFDLASTSRDRTLRVWNLESERYLRLVKVPETQSHGKNTVDSSNKNRLWVTTLWIPGAEKFVLCTTISGEVVQVDLSNEKRPTFVPFDTKQAGGHNRCIFNISFCDNILCSVSLDRQIVLYDMKQLKSTYALGTLGGFAQCMDFSPIDIGRLAVGCGDKTVRIWCTASNSSPYSSHMLWQGINGKVTALSWHPQKENHLAFGTDEGHVGVLDGSGHKPPTICRTYHKKIVYTLCWGPCIVSAAKDKIVLYSCGDGNILIHDPSQHEKEAKNINDLLNPKSSSKKSELVWKQDYSALALGCEDGTIEIYSRELQLLATLKAQKNLIQCLRWHPISTALNPVSIYQNWLASSSYETVIHIYDLSDVLGKECSSPKTLTQSTIQLVGHSNRVNSLSWNPHIDGRLASASYDGSVQVWNASTVEPMGNYRGHRGLVFCVQWSATDPELLFSGGDDLSVQQFSSSSLAHTLPPSKKSKKPKKVVQDKPTAEENNLEITENSDGENQLCNGEVKETSEPPKVAVSSDVSQTTTSSAAKKKKKKQAVSQKSCFPLCNSLDSRGKEGMLQDIRTVCNEIHRTSDRMKSMFLNDINPPDLTTAPNLGFFLKSSGFRKTREVEEAGHRASGNSELLFQLSLWHSDIEGVLKEAAELGQLSDYLVSLAPLGCRALWLEMCHKYAQQLVKEENYIKAANYYVACHKIYEAVDMLVSQHCYREALALAKGRFPQTDDVFQRILHAWAAKAEKDGNYELVAKCHLSLCEYDRAAKCLTRRNDAASHATAAYISATSGAAIETEDCIITCIHQALTRNEWIIAREMLMEQQKLNVVPELLQLAMVVRVHELFTSSLKAAQDENNATPLEDLLVQKSGPVILWKGKTPKDGKSFLELLNEKITLEETLVVLSSPRTLLGRLSGQRSLSSKEIIYETAVGLTMHLFPQDKANPEVELARVLAVNFSAEPEYTILNHLCKLLFPFDLSLPLNSNKQSEESCSNKAVAEAFTTEQKLQSCDANTSLAAFFAANLIDALSQEASKLSKGTYLKHQGACNACEHVLENVTAILERISILLKHDNFVKNECLNVKLRKLNENIAKVSAMSRGNEDSGSKLQQLQKQKEELLAELESLPENVKTLPYPKIALATGKGKEVCKHLALAVCCPKTSAKIKSLADKLFSSY